MKNKFILAAKRLAAVALAGAMMLAPGNQVLASSVGTSYGSALDGTATSAGNHIGTGSPFSMPDGHKALWRTIVDASKGNDMMLADFVNLARKSALNAKNKAVAAMDNLEVKVTANGKNGKTIFKQSAADAVGSFDVIRGKAATKSTKFSVRIRVLDKDGKILEGRKAAVSIPNKSGGKTTVVFKGEWDGKSGQIFVSTGKKTVCVSYPKVGQKLQFTLYATGAENNTGARTYTLSRILTGKKASSDIISYVSGTDHS